MPGKAGGPNAVRRLVTVGAPGAPTAIFATGPTRGWRIFESPLTTAGTAQTSTGFQVQIPNDNSANGFSVWFGRPVWSATVSPQDQYFENMNVISEHGPIGEGFAGPGNATPGSGITPTTATLLCNVQALVGAGSGTTIEIVEYF
ncbi:MAG: hypothetical protein ABSE51_19910 [Terracidiphilus sp.]